MCDVMLNSSLKILKKDGGSTTGKNESSALKYFCFRCF